MDIEQFILTVLAPQMQRIEDKLNALILALAEDEDEPPRLTLDGDADGEERQPDTPL